MNTNANIAGLIQERRQINNRLSNLYYGSIEIRNNEKKSFLYVHHREKNAIITRYISEYNDELFASLVDNNNLAKTLRRRLREINKILKEENFVEYKINEDVKMNIAFAKGNLVDLIYNQLSNNHLNVGYDEVKEIVTNEKVNNMNVEDILSVINLKKTWDFLTTEDTIMFPSNFSLLCEINNLLQKNNSFVSRGLRNVSIKISGTNHIPFIPFEENVINDFNEIASTRKILDRAINYYCYILYNHLFLNNNKDTALLFSNHVLIKGGKGLFVILSKYKEEHEKLLIDYYNTKDAKKLKKFLIDKCYQKI